MELKISAPPNIIRTVIDSCNSKKEKMLANSASMDNMREALLAVVYFCAAVCSKKARHVETAIR